MTSQPIHKRYDVVIVGARVAGAATGMLLAKAGLRVLVFDKARYGSDTLSTHALMRPAVMLLHRWGILDRLIAEGTPPVRRTTFWYSDGDEVDVASVDIKPRGGVDALYAPRRTVLDRALVDEARAAGAEVCHGLRLVRVLGADEAQVHGVVVQDTQGRTHEIHTDLVIGADGRNSRVAREVGAAAYVTGRHGSATSYGYFRNLPIDGNRWYFRPGTGSGAIPTNDGLTLVFGALQAEEASQDPEALRRSFNETITRSAPDVGAALPQAELVGKLWAFPGMPGFLRQSWGPGWALVGDAGYMSDPITAHGITNAFRDAHILSQTIVEGASLNSYQLIRDGLSQRFFEISDRVASYDWNIPTVQRYHRIMSEEMGIEERFLSQSRGEAAPSPRAPSRSRGMHALQDERAPAAGV